jgi:hypothetical protein
VKHRSDDLKRSIRQEKDLAKKLDGSRNAMSGAGWVRKADVRTDEFLIEAKTTDNKGYRLTLTELRELRKQAIMDDRTPVFVVDIQGHRYVVLEEDDWMELIEDE